MRNKISLVFVVVSREQKRDIDSRALEYHVTCIPVHTTCTVHEFLGSNFRYGMPADVLDARSRPFRENSSAKKIELLL